MINDELLHKWINKTISDSELEIFKARPEYESLTQLYKQTEHLAGPELDSESMLQNILKENKQSTTVHVPKSKIRSLWIKMAAVASVLIIAGLFLFNSQDGNININGEAGMTEMLPDGSKMELLRNSTFSYDKTKWNKTRNVNLAGTAEFSVTKGKPFSVLTKKGKVQVLGTQFIVSDQEEKFEVSCSEGKVKVITKNGNNEVILTANESYTSLDNGGTITRTRNMTKLKSIKLKTIISEIENKFNTEIELKEIDPNQILTSGFQNDNLDNAIKTVTMALGNNYTIQEGKVIISK